MDSKAPTEVRDGEGMLLESAAKSLHFRLQPLPPPSSMIVVNTLGRESGGSEFETYSGVW